eukprot:5104795-Pyramimonas_sp.AAC.1
MQYASSRKHLMISRTITHTRMTRRPKLSCSTGGLQLCSRASFSRNHMFLLSRQARPALPVRRSRSWVMAHVLHNILRRDADGVLLRRCDAQRAFLASRGHLSVGRV